MTEVILDDRGVTYRDERGTASTLAWIELATVEVQTTDAGPVDEDVFWVLRSDNVELLIPQSSCGVEALVERLQRLPAFNNDAIIAAMSSANNVRFVCWRRDGRLSDLTYETIELDGEDAIASLMARLEAFPQSGEYPFLIGGEFELERAMEQIELADHEPRQIVEASASVSVPSWIAQQRAADEKCESHGDDLIGKWPGENVDKGEIGLHRSAISGIVKRRVFMGMARVEESWQLPAVMRFGGWNSCPEPEVHCAFHHHWQALYGARITGLSNDTIECLVESPPRNSDAALRLAWEQYWYCRDIVTQGCGTINRLAATLMNSPYWFFWWD